MPKSDIVFVPFPFDDSFGTKPRPALCMTDHIGEHEHVVVAFISTQLPDSLKVEASDILLPESAEWFVSTGLRTTSVLRLHRLTTIAARFIRRKIGGLPPEQFNEAISRLKGIFVESESA